MCGGPATMIYLSMDENKERGEPDVGKFLTVCAASNKTLYCPMKVS